MAATATGAPGAPPFYDPNAPTPPGAASNGYDSVFRKMTRHEIGHGQNLKHPSMQVKGGSVMNIAIGGCQNDNCDELPTAEAGIQPCDNSRVQRSYPETEACTDFDGDEVTTCDGDCYDLDASLTISCPDEDGGGGGGGGNCHSSATSENPWLDGQGCELCWDGIDNDCNGLTDAQGPGCWNRCNCPVLLDTEGDGLDLTGVGGGVLFDFDGDGTRERLSWTSEGADDAWLALDRNGNGGIDSARELFGNLTQQPAPPSGEIKNGFLALAEYDAPANGGDGDGVVGVRDAVFTNLRLWRDVNHNGVSEPAELHDLPSLGIDGVRLNYKESKRTDEHGNSFRYRAKVDYAKGAEAGRWAWDVFLVRAP